MRVENMTSPQGNFVPNQFIIYDKRYTYFQSYNSIIIKVDNKLDKTYLDINLWNVSKTTSKYRNLFLGLGTADIKKKIKEGEYLFRDLNKEK